MSATCKTKTHHKTGPSMVNCASFARMHDENKPKFDWGGHPLFPRPIEAQGPDPRKFELLRVVRISSDRKTRESCPVLFKASELRSWEQIVEMFGAEWNYRLLAICSKTGRITARSEEVYFGDVPPSKPMTASAVLPPLRYSPPLPLRPSGQEAPRTAAQELSLFENLIAIWERQMGIRPPLVQTLRRGSR